MKETSELRESIEDLYEVFWRVPAPSWSDRVESFNEVATWVRSEPVKKVMIKVAAGFPRYEFVERAYTSLP